MKKTLIVLLLLSTNAFAAAPEPLHARHGVVASTSPIASRIGVDILKRGGNAVDAAVAVALTLAVVWPSAGNIGGGGFMMVRKANGDIEAIDYRERAPLSATHDMYLDENKNIVKGASTVGYKAVGVPGTIAGLVLAHKRHGHMRWADLVEPARKLAAEGFTVNYHLAAGLHHKNNIEKLEQFPASKHLFLRDGKPWEMGETFVQTDLASTLGRIKNDPADFYIGETAKLIVADMQKHGGLITINDLKTYTPTVRKPIRTTYRGHEIVTMPPPSSGGIALIEMLNMLEPMDLKSMGWHSSKYVHTVTEVMRRAFADRAQFLGDTDFVKVPMAGLTSRAYAEQRAKSIDPAHASNSKDVGAGDPAPYESSETTHFTIIDSEGNVVTNTYTLNDSFGSGVTARGTGILLNDEMDDFTSKPGEPNVYQLIQGEANAIQSRKRPLSSMTPTIVLKDGKVEFAIGSPGGPTIINTVLQVVLNVIDFNMDIQEAISAPRFHHQWLPDEIFWESFEFNQDTRDALERMGYHFREKPSGLGDAQGIQIDASGVRLGASDPRLGGAPAGY
ncbi:MAG TPA: gamma-glutamyltransferase [Thermoanaerobaculia bacterium]|nr:gamma-glutamyltransferase [Thermoanaerobaculia bacterium]